ncbi:breast cancer type 1 susceptibility protein homolog [Plodia interpunctella]|uniref:breast cancer type 1 susceptibility protein homolog n=1 Tax=Plodia interpunctella TaxID=58824 RepID=UPI002367A8E4|nr:breast cancer type 1 susceptibility protein homolog [Plodia interpunctella]
MENNKNLDSAVITRLISPFVEQATCLDCCKLYIAPETASCGHTACHACWRKRKSCLCCAAPLDRSSLKLNDPIQVITEHVHNMCDLFEEVFNFRVDTFSIGDGFTQRQSQPDPTNEVQNWLASSQNHFSAPISSESMQDVTAVEHLTSTVQIHSHTKKILSPQKVVHKQTMQDDWEKIEQLPDTDELIVKQTKVVENNNKYSTENPRRSSRKREFKNDEHIPIALDTSKDKCSSKNSSSETENKTVKTMQKWNNVKKMRKEFSKLNKKNRSKLNVSIEMCKKNKLNQAKANSADEIAGVEQNTGQLVDIEDDTPCDNIKETPQNHKENSVPDHTNIQNSSTDKNIGKSQLNAPKKDPPIEIQNEEVVKSNNTVITEDIKTKNAKIICDHDLFNNEKENPSKMPFYKKGNLHIETNTEVKDNTQTVNYNIDCSNSNNAEDIEITIKIGDTVANIYFKRKKKECRKSCSNQEIQTSIGIHTLEQESHCNKQNIENNETNAKNGQNTTKAEFIKLPAPNLKINYNESSKLNKSVSTKKNTTSADTVTAQFEITDSVEKELSSVMELEEQTQCNKQNSKIIVTKSADTNAISSKSTQSKNHITSCTTQPKNVENENVDSAQIPNFLIDQDIFDSGSVQEQNVHTLQNVKNAPSEILMPTMKTVKGKSLKKAEKRNREANEDIEMTNKKQKVQQNSPLINDIVEFDKSLQKEFPQDSEGINYDAIMGQVFANIDADIHNTPKSTADVNDLRPPCKTGLDQLKTVVLVPEKADIIHIDDSGNGDAIAPVEHSENVFSVIEKENNSNEIVEVQKSKAAEIENLTPEIFIEEGDKLCTPHENIDDDDKSVVEETPQKSVSFTKPKNRSENAQPNLSTNKQINMNEFQLQSVVDVSDSETSSKVGKEVTVIDIGRKTTETPLTINRFVDEIKHKSTPVARKSLNFDHDDVDPEQTLCPTTEPAKTTQEREFMSKAFENTPISPVRKPLAARNMKVDEKRNYCLAGSCLSSMELMKVKVLCRQNNWKYVDKYTTELTHLVVGVDDENKSQRSVKYMCALAASKWIVSFQWIDACLSTNKIINEELFEALDGTGEPGPRRSRSARCKLFQGISFYCLPPFSVLQLDTLKNMLEAAGGRVVNDVRSVRAEREPALLLAEPEDTQENKFIYMAVELSVVPVNYEWVLNCLGGYTLSSVMELLLCPAALLPAAVASWPPHLVSQDD